MEAFATSPYGLGLPRRRYYSLTLRELAAHQRIREEVKTADTRFQLCLYAELQSTLSNGLLPREDKQRWTPHDFYPDYPAPKQKQMSVQDKILMIKMALMQASPKGAMRKVKRPD